MSDQSRAALGRGMIGGRRPALSGNRVNALAQFLPASLSLEDEIRRLVSAHGWEAVAQAAKKLAKPNKRKEMEREDWRVLGPILQEEATRILAGEKPRTNSAIAALALPNVRKTDIMSGTRRLLMRLATEWRKSIQSIYGINHAEIAHPWRVLHNLCLQDQPTQLATEYAQDKLAQLQMTMAALRESGQSVPDEATASELEALWRTARSIQAQRGLLGQHLLNETK